jgi:hypothetical protein
MGINPTRKSNLNGNIILRKYINVIWKIYSNIPPQTQAACKLEFGNENELKAVEVDGWIKAMPKRKIESDGQRT